MFNVAEGGRHLPGRAGIVSCHSSCSSLRRCRCRPCGWLAFVDRLVVAAQTAQEFVAAGWLISRT